MQRLSSTIDNLLVTLIVALAVLAGQANFNFADASKKHKKVYRAVSDFVAVSDAEPIWYVDTERGSLAVDAAKYPDQSASVKTTFKGQSGTYLFWITGLGEIDGESNYILNVNGEEIGRATNPETEQNYQPFEHGLGEFELQTGDVIEVTFNSVSNGKIPEDGGTAYARGRWTKLSLTCLSCSEPSESGEKASED